VIFALTKQSFSINAQFPVLSFPPLIGVSLGSSDCLQTSFGSVSSLIMSPDMLSRRGEVYLNIPFDVIGDYILNPSLLATWNSDYSSGGDQTSLPICQKLLAKFTTKINVTVPPGYSFKPPIILTVNRTKDVALFGWEFGMSTADGKDNLYYGAHWIGAFRITINGEKVVQYISWEKMYGVDNDFVAKNRAAFEFGMGHTVLQPDIVGGLCLEFVYSQTGALNPVTVEKLCKQYRNH